MITPSPALLPASEKVVCYCIARWTVRNGNWDFATESALDNPGGPWHFLLEHGFVRQGFALICDPHAPDMVLMGWKGAWESEPSEVIGADGAPIGFEGGGAGA